MTNWGATRSEVAFNFAVGSLALGFILFLAVFVVEGADATLSEAGVPSSISRSVGFAFLLILACHQWIAWRNHEYRSSKRRELEIELTRLSDDAWAMAVQVTEKIAQIVGYSPEDRDDNILPSNAPLTDADKDQYLRGAIFEYGVAGYGNKPAVVAIVDIAALTQRIARSWPDEPDIALAVARGLYDDDDDDDLDGKIAAIERVLNELELRQQWLGAIRQRMDSSRKTQE